MPELPDLCAYIHAMHSRLIGQSLKSARIFSPFLLRTVDPPLNRYTSKCVRDISRLGKRIVIEFEDNLFLLIHLMISGRLSWSDQPVAGRQGGRSGLAVVSFTSGDLVLFEAGTKKRAALHCVSSHSELSKYDFGGLDPLHASQEEFRSALLRENRTLKRSLTSPNTLSGIGNAYSDEILHAARLSPLRLTQSLSEIELVRLHSATITTLTYWKEKLRNYFGDRFPKPSEITAFRPEFAVHGKFGRPCPECQLPIQRIRYAENETNYCAKCQNEGRLLADRALSRILKSDWPKTIEEMVGD
jgi:formamidopyrimidine-DNA glycosylase